MDFLKSNQNNFNDLLINFSKKIKLIYYVIELEKIKFNNRNIQKNY